MFVFPKEQPHPTFHNHSVASQVASHGTSSNVNIGIFKATQIGTAILAFTFHRKNHLVEGVGFEPT